jgi:hypothetical protein
MDTIFKSLLVKLRNEVFDDLTIVLKPTKVIKISNSIYDESDNPNRGFDININGNVLNKDESYNKDKILEIITNLLSVGFELEKIITDKIIYFEMPSPEVLQLFTLKQNKEEAIQVVIFLYKYFYIFIKKAFDMVINNAQNQEITSQLVHFDNSFKDEIIDYINDNLAVIIFDEDLESDYSNLFQTNVISQDVSKLRQMLNTSKTSTTDYFATNYELKFEYLERLYFEIKGQVELSVSQQLGRLILTQETLNEQYSEKLARNLLMKRIVPLIKENIIDWLEIRINALNKNIKTSITTPVKTIKKQGFKMKHHRQTKISLISKFKKLKKELETGSYSLDTITQVFYPMIRDQNTLTAWIYSEYPLEIKMNSIIQLYLQERAVPQVPQQEQPQQPVEDFNLNISTAPINIPEEDCPICFNVLDSSERLCQLPCGHNFHCNCLKGMRKQKLKCPVCNADNNGVINSNTFGKIKNFKVLCKELKYLLTLK